MGAKLVGAERDSLIATIVGALPGASWLPMGMAGRPWMTGLLEGSGLVCLEVATDPGELPDAAARLNQAQAGLTADLGGAASGVPLVARVVVESGFDEISGRMAKVALSPDQDAISAAVGASKASFDSTGLRERLWPESSFESWRAHQVDDATGVDRQSQRRVLDSQQLAVASALGSGITLLTGPAGSGKSLVLAARARMLAAAHPDWDIRIVCYNRSLVPYLTALVGGIESVVVSTAYELLAEHGMQFEYRAEDQGAARALGRWIQTEPDLDAVLVDEVQDIARPWLEWLASRLRPDRGGMLMTGDPAQALYLDPAGEDNVLTGAQRIVLTRSYRSTAQILGVAALLSEAEVTDNQSMDGPLVQLVYGDRWDMQSEFIGYEVQQLVSQGTSYGDIAVLYTKRPAQLGRIQAVLDEIGAPFHWVGENAESKVAEVGDQITVSTVHSAKGLEYPVVFVFGVEALKASERRQANVGFVAATRAQDRLYLTYTRPNDMIRRLGGSEFVASTAWPDDWSAGG